MSPVEAYKSYAYQTKYRYEIRFYRLDQKLNQSLISFRHELVDLGTKAGWDNEITKENLAKVLNANAKHSYTLPTNMLIDGVE
ncbi:hypothetical protein A3Q56_04977, partial [Intoshia linei]